MRNGPLCSQPAPRHASFCNHCGAPFWLWRIHSPEQGTLALVAHKAIPAYPDGCRSHGDCLTACPTSAILGSGGDSAIAEGCVVPKLRTKVQPIGADIVVLDESGSIREVRVGFVFVLMGAESPDKFLQRAGVEIVEKAVAA